MVKGSLPVRHLREWRASRLMSIRDLAEAAEIAPKTLTDIEYSRRVPTFATMRRISAALGVSPHEIAEFANALRARGATDTPDPEGD